MHRQSAICGVFLRDCAALYGDDLVPCLQFPSALWQSADVPDGQRIPCDTRAESNCEKDQDRHRES